MTARIADMAAMIEEQDRMFEIDDMREFLIDCGRWDSLKINALPYACLCKMIETHYDGGLAGFRKAGSVVCVGGACPDVF